MHKKMKFFMLKGMKMFDSTGLFAYNPHPDFGLVVFIILSSRRKVKASL